MILQNQTRLVIIQIKLLSNHTFFLHLYIIYMTPEKEKVKNKNKKAIKLKFVYLKERKLTVIFLLPLLPILIFFGLKKRST